MRRTANREMAQFTADRKAMKAQQALENGGKIKVKPKSPKPKEDKKSDNKK